MPPRTLRATYTAQATQAVAAAKGKDRLRAEGLLTELANMTDADIAFRHDLCRCCGNAPSLLNVINPVLEVTDHWGSATEVTTIIASLRGSHSPLATFVIMMSGPYVHRVITIQADGLSHIAGDASMAWNRQEKAVADNAQKFLTERAEVQAEERAIRRARGGR